LRGFGSGVFPFDVAAVAFAAADFAEVDFVVAAAFALAVAGFGLSAAGFACPFPGVAGPAAGFAAAFDGPVVSGLSGAGRRGFAGGPGATVIGAGIASQPVRLIAGWFQAGFSNNRKPATKSPLRPGWLRMISSSVPDSRTCQA